MPHTATVTAKTGPDRQNTAIVLNNVQGIDFQLDSKRLFIQVENQAGDNIKEYDLNGVTAVVVAIVAGNWSVTIT